MMENRISALLRIIREEIRLYRDLLEHARRKTALLVHGRLDSILVSNNVEETFNVKLRILEDEFSRLCRELCQGFGIPREEFTLLKLAEGVDQSVAEEIKSQTTLFKNLIDQLKRINQRNMKLMESSMSYSRGLLDFISNATSSYQGTGLLRPLPAVHNTISRQG